MKKLSLPCVFCGEPTYIYARNDGGCYSVAVMCEHCDSHGPLRYGTDKDDVRRRAALDYSRSTEYRDRLVTVCQRLVGTDCNLNDVIDLARQVLGDFRLSSERRSDR